MIRRALTAAALLAALGVVSTGTQAQLFRAYLALNGNDGNPCTLVQPCRLLPAALTAVADGGEIWMLDSANYNVGQVVVSKSVSILAVPGTVGSLVATTPNSVLQVTNNAKVALRNLSFARMAGVAGNTMGIEVLNSVSLVVHDCSFAGFTWGLMSTAMGTVTVTDSYFRDGTAGIETLQGADLTVSRSTFANLAGTAVRLRGDTIVFPGAYGSALIADSVFTKVDKGVWTHAPNSTAITAVTGNRFHMVVVGVQAGDDGGVQGTVSATNNVFMTTSTAITTVGDGRAFASGNRVSQSTNGFVASAGGVFESAGDNVMRSNSNDFSGTITTFAKK